MTYKGVTMEKVECAECGAEVKLADAHKCECCGEILCSKHKMCSDCIKYYPLDVK